MQSRHLACKPSPSQVNFLLRCQKKYRGLCPSSTLRFLHSVIFIPSDTHSILNEWVFSPQQDSKKCIVVFWLLKSLGYLYTRVFVCMCLPVCDGKPSNSESVCNFYIQSFSLTECIVVVQVRKMGGCLSVCLCVCVSVCLCVCLSVISRVPKLLGRFQPNLPKWVP